MKHFIAKEGTEFLCLQETKASTLSDNKCFSLWRDSNVGWIHNEGVNGAGSILSMWHKEAFRYDKHVVGSGFIVILGQHLKSNSLCVVIRLLSGKL